MTGAAPDRPLFLVGFMGVGKTTCGHALASSLGREFVDTDRFVEQREGRTIERIFAESGEPFFRSSEREALHASADDGDRVVATGGGIFDAAGNRRWMKHAGFTVWLDATFDAVRRRLGNGRDRPLWKPEDLVGMRVLFERRRAVYSLCHVRVAVGFEDPSRLAERIIRYFL